MNQTKEKETVAGIPPRENGQCPNQSAGCKGTLRYYDGCLGYEALRCDACSYELDLNAEANARATKERETAESAAQPENRATWETANDLERQRQSDRLRAKVEGQNKVNTLANEYEKQLIEAFRPFIGKKVLTNSGIAVRVSPHIPKPPAGLRCWRPGSRTLYYEVDTSVPAGEYSCVYCRASVYVGELDGFNLAKVLEPQKPRRTDYTVEEILAKRKALREARDAMYAAQSSLGNFGEYDQ